MWLAHQQQRIGLGCMHLSRDDERALAVLCAAIDAGITVFDTARAYAIDDDDRGHSERLLARAIALRPSAAPSLRVITKGGMQRPAGRWLVDGRARSLAADCAASKAALGAVPIDLYLLHAPDPSVPLATSVRALASLLDKGHVKHIGLCNVNRAQLDEALAIAPIGAVQVSLSWFDDRALIGGVVERCLERDIAVIAHTPLGGARRKSAVARDRALQRVAAKHDASTHAVALAALLDLDPRVLAIPGATTVATARDCASASQITLDDDDRAILQRIPRARARKPRAPTLDPTREVVLLMGLQGAGKTDALSSWLARGYERLNRDERGGTMKKL
ncbi:MAG TPA: aldo/keto reductase, partial [Myxococcota bacterium]